MKDKTILITGANSGIGLETAKNLAQTGAKIWMMARNPEKGKVAVEAVRASSGNDNIHLQLIDLASLSSVRDAAKNLLTQNPRIDVLINNAGLIKMKKETTKDGFETVFGVNHLGPYLLTRLLLDRIQETAQTQGEARTIFVSSALHQNNKGIQFDDLMWDNRKYSGMKAYGESKLANILTANEIARRYGKDGIIAHSVHPGGAKSNIYRNGNIKGISLMVTKLVYALIGISLAKGAETPTFLAQSTEAAKSNGKYWAKNKITKAKLPENEAEVAARLWKVSEELTK